MATISERLREGAVVETIEVPMTRLGDGRDFITDETVVNEPAVRDFISRLSNYWQRDEMRCGWVSTALSRARTGS